MFGKNKYTKIINDIGDEILLDMKTVYSNQLIACGSFRCSVNELPPIIIFIVLQSFNELKDSRKKRSCQEYWSAVASDWLSNEVRNYGWPDVGYINSRINEYSSLWDFYETYEERKMHLGSLFMYRLHSGEDSPFLMQEIDYRRTPQMKDQISALCGELSDNNKHNITSLFRYCYDEVAAKMLDLDANGKIKWPF